MDLDKYIVIVAPHTSNIDFITGLAIRTVTGMKTKFLGKKELFKFPVGMLFRALGGFPVDRSASHNMVDEVVKIFNQHHKFSIAIAPEGTRSKVNKLRTGFYYIAKAGKIPIVMAALDYKNRQVIFAEPFLPTSDTEKDFAKIYDFYRPIHGKNPELGMMHF